jgi:hypothetical protein
LKEKNRILIIIWLLFGIFLLLFLQLDMEIRK